MTNEQKAKELLMAYCWNGVMIDETMATDLAVKMAEWKEQQMIEKMENFVKGLYLPAYSYLDRENSELIEDIKQAMIEE